jgi:hypothetical protein
MMRHWKQLVRLSDPELGQIDLAEVNLGCAADLPDAAPLPYAECLDRLNHYARCVQHYTDRRMPEFRNQPKAYDCSEGIFRMVCLVTLLQRQFGVGYNPAKTGEDAPFDTADTFIHGALVGDGGTCASLPVIYAAVGRRLGYPLKLVSTNCHGFVRWDQPGGERFNIEVNDTGLNCDPDGYYRTGRYAVSPESNGRPACCARRHPARNYLGSWPKGDSGGST